MFLRSCRIKKYGVHIKADFTRLFKDCGFTDQDLPFSGATELGALAKHHNIVDRANISLADLTCLVLHRYLPKDESVRLSNAWDDINLPNNEQQYAALDVFATWSIYEGLSVSPTGQTVTADTPAGTSVKLLSRDQSSIVAFGIIAPDRPAKFECVNVTKTRAIVNITSVVQAGYLVRGNLLKSKQDTSLGTLSTYFPFGLLCNIRDLQVTPHVDCNIERGSISQPTLLPASDELDTQHDNTTHLAQDPDHDDLTSWPQSIDYDPEEEQPTCDSIPDLAGVNQAQTLRSISSVSVQNLAMDDGMSSSSYAETVIRSRVLGDIWHLMHQFKIPVHHGLRRPFARALRDAIFIPDPEDKSAVEKVLASKNVTWNQMVLWKSDWVWRRVKRFVPSPENLCRRVTEVFEVYGPLQDATTNQPLFNDNSWQQAKNILENIRRGYYSDPPGISLYTAWGKDNNNLPIYRCARGTNNVEGGVHQNIIKCFGSYNASPQFAVNLLRDYSLCHNLKVGYHSF